MGDAGSRLVYPTVSQIVDANRALIAHSGGSFAPPDNLMARGSLEHVLTAISQPVYGHHLYPSLYDKVAGVCSTIIRDHAFWDRNKRTGV